MNKELNLKQVILIVIPFAILFYAYVWATGKAVETLAPLTIKSNASGHLILPLSDGHIYEFTPQGELINHIDSHALGISNYHGDIQFINRNELIIYGGYEEKNALENLATFARITPDKEFTANQGLWHCYLEESTCYPFSQQLSNLKHTYHLTFDHISKHLYLANTALHEVYQLNLQGDILSQTQKDSVKFPNQLRIFANQLWLADTNHHKLVSFQLGQNALTKAMEEFEIDGAENCHRSGKRDNPLALLQADPHCYPNAIAFVDDTLWVGVAKPNMENNEIQQFSTTGQFLGRLDISTAEAQLDLKLDIDPTSFAQAETFVVFSDMNNRQIYRYDLSNKTWSMLNVDGLSEKLAVSQSEQSYYLNISYAVKGLFILLIAIGVILGIKPHLEFYKAKHATEIAVSPTLPQPQQSPFWFSINKKMKYLVWTYAGLVLVSVMLLALVLTSANETLEKINDDPHFILLCATFIYMFLAGFYLLYRPFQAKLGIAGRLVLVSEKSGKTAISQLDQVYRVGKRGLLVEDSLFLIGSPQLQFIDQQEFEQYLKPRFHHMDNMNEWGYFKYRLANPNKDSIIMIFLMLPLVVISFFLI